MESQMVDRLKELTERRDQLAAGIQKGLTELEQLNGAIAVLGEFTPKDDDENTASEEAVEEIAEA
tara:strand:+ start:160 stop:354 length:195 start_codon:yes stop_codon:yes gene_type:complete